MDLITQYDQAGYHVARTEEIFGRGSSLSDGCPQLEGAYREASIVEQFGYGSELGDGGLLEVVAPRFSDEPLFHLILVVTLVAYLYMLIRSRKFISTIYANVWGNSSEARMVAQGGELPLQRFKQVSTAIGLLMVSLVGVRLADGHLSTDIELFGYNVAGYAPLISLIFVGVYVAWYYAMHEVAEWLANAPSVQLLSSVVHMDFVRGVVLLYPLVAVWLLSDGGSSQWFSLMLIVLVLLLLLLYLKDTFLFFVAKKISILYWILYLCTAILLPFSFLLRLLPAYFA